jgi:hypothetical protein
MTESMRQPLLISNLTILLFYDNMGNCQSFHESKLLFNQLYDLQSQIA